VALPRAVRLCVLLLFAIPMLAQTGAITTTDHVSFDPLFDQCSNELIQFNGSVTVQTTNWSDSSGAIFFRVRELPAILTGVGLTSGRQYWLLVGGTQVQFNGPDSNQGLPFFETVVFAQTIIGQGVPADFQLSLFHLSIDASGHSSPELDQSIDQCLGH